MNMVAFAIALVYGFMLAEQRVSNHHERWLRARGAIERAGDVYRAMAWLYPLAFLAMGLEGAWRAVRPAMAWRPSGPW